MRYLTAAALLLSLSTACVEDVGEGKNVAEVEEPTEEQAPPEPTPAEAGIKLAVDTDRSELKALGAKITAKHPIIFHEYSGEVELRGEEVAGVSFEADVASLEADHPKLTVHLRDEDFLHVDAHPKATFQSTRVVKGSEAEGMTHMVTGDLSVRGVTRRVTFPAAIEVEPSQVKANTEFVINRQDFGITYPGKPDDLVQDNVVLTVAFTAPREVASAEPAAAEGKASKGKGAKGKRH